MFVSFLSLEIVRPLLIQKQKRHSSRNASHFLNLCPHGNTPCRDGIVFPRFHPACFPWKTCFISVMITESPCRIRAAPRWSSVSRNTKTLAPCGFLSEMAGSLLSSSTLFLTSVILPQHGIVCQEGTWFLPTELRTFSQLAPMAFEFRISSAACLDEITLSFVMQLFKTTRPASCSLFPEVEPQRSSITAQSDKSL